MHRQNTRSMGYLISSIAAPFLVSFAGCSSPGGYVQPEASPKKAEISVPLSRRLSNFIKENSTNGADLELSVHNNISLFLTYKKDRLTIVYNVRDPEGTANVLSSVKYTDMEPTDDSPDEVSSLRIHVQPDGSPGIEEVHLDQQKWTEPYRKHLRAAVDLLVIPE